MDGDQRKEEHRKGQEGVSWTATLDNTQLFFQPPQLLHADVVATAHHNDHRAQAARQLSLILQLFDNVAVHGCQGRTAGRLHQDLLIICRESRYQEGSGPKLIF